MIFEKLTVFETCSLGAPGKQGPADFIPQMRLSYFTPSSQSCIPSFPFVGLAASAAPVSIKRQSEVASEASGARGTVIQPCTPGFRVGGLVASEPLVALLSPGVQDFPSCVWQLQVL